MAGNQEIQVATLGREQQPSKMVTSSGSDLIDIGETTTRTPKATDEV